MGFAGYSMGCDIIHGSGQMITTSVAQMNQQTTRREVRSVCSVSACMELDAATVAAVELDRAMRNFSLQTLKSW